MNDWQVFPEIIGCNASLRMAAMQASDAVEMGHHFVVEGEPGSGRRMLARSAWNRRRPGSRSLFTMDCRMFHADAAESLLFGERTSHVAQNTIQLGKLNLTPGGGLLLLHAELLPQQTQKRLAQALDEYRSPSKDEGIQLLMTCASSLEALLPLHPDLAGLLLRIRVPALRERVEDIRAIAESFLQNASPFERIRCSQALIDRFCRYEWPGNVTELRSVLRRLLLEAPSGLLDVHHLSGLMCRDETCFALLRDMPYPDTADVDSNFMHRAPVTETWSVQ